MSEDLSTIKNLEGGQKEDVLLTHEQIQWVNIPLEKEGKVLNDKDRTDFVSSLDFFHRVYKTEDVDEEEFASRFKKFKLLSGNKCEHELSRQRVEIQKWKVMSELPKVLGVHINRLGYDNFGNQFLDRRFIDFPEFLDLSKKRSGVATPYLDGEEAQNKKFKLYGVIEHMGNPSCGHYIAAKRVCKIEDEAGASTTTPTGLSPKEAEVAEVAEVKESVDTQLEESKYPSEEGAEEEKKSVEDGEKSSDEKEPASDKTASSEDSKVWVLCNDNVTKEIRLDQVLSSKAYMLLYRQVDE
mmetsp:Transcript_42342/g.64964  ORF Transcript_42342/g.64964 Transcript_42342/m.64964 type:complete len:297 (-) Transcript_42342:35-925(-)